MTLLVHGELAQQVLQGTKGPPILRKDQKPGGEIFHGYSALWAELEAQLKAWQTQLCHEDVLACLAFAAERERRLVVPPPVA